MNKRIGGFIAGIMVAIALVAGISYAQVSGVSGQTLFRLLSSKIVPISENWGFGVGTSTPWAMFAVEGISGQTNPIFSVASSTGESFLSVSATGYGTTTVSGLTVSGTATSTSNVGWNLTGGCFAVGGACVGGGGAVAGSDTQVIYNNVGAYAGSAALIWNNVASRLTATNASSTNATIGTSLWVTGSLQIPNGAAPTVDATGECALDTTSDQLACYGATAKKIFGNGYIYPAFTYATSTAWTATTTIPLGTAFVAETWREVQCFTDTGTLNVQFGDGTNKMILFNASTTVGTVGLSTNNTFVAAEKRYVDIGTPLSTPTKVSCTISKELTSD